MNNSLVCVIYTLLNMDHTYLSHPYVDVHTYVTPAFVQKPRTATNDHEEPATGSVHNKFRSVLDCALCHSESLRLVSNFDPMLLRLCRQCNMHLSSVMNHELLCSHNDKEILKALLHIMACAGKHQTPLMLQGTWSICGSVHGMLQALKSCRSAFCINLLHP